jgi:hypothetical protein
VARVLLLSAGVLLALAVSTAAAAQPAVRYAVTGDCPSADELARALGRQVRAAAFDEPAWSVEVERSAPRTTLLLRSPDGEPSVQRAIESDDCPALAQALALIVLMQFAELQLLAAPLPEQAPSAPPPERGEPEPPDEPHAPALALDIALLAAAELGIAPFAAAPAAALALGLGPPGEGWLVRLDARISTPVQQRSATDRVERWTSALRVEAGGRLRLGARFWLAGSAGGGLTLARVSALDLAGQPGALRVSPAVSISALFGLELTARWSLRLQTGASVYPRIDRYLVDPEGVVAKSPRGELIAGVGLQFDSAL